MTFRFLAFVVNHQPIAQPRYEQAWVTDKHGVRKRGAHIRPLASGEPHPVNTYKQYIAGITHNAIVDYDRVARLTGMACWADTMDRPMRLDLTFVMPRPAKLKAGEREWSPIKPDRDNLEKALKDALKGLAWNDDCQVVDGRTRKVYSSSSEQSHVCVRIEVLTEPPHEE